MTFTAGALKLTQLRNLLRQTRLLVFSSKIPLRSILSGVMTILLFLLVLDLLLTGSSLAQDRLVPGRLVPDLLVYRPGLALCQIDLSTRKDHIAHQEDGRSAQLPDLPLRLLLSRITQKIMLGEMRRHRKLALVTLVHKILHLLIRVGDGKTYQLLRLSMLPQPKDQLRQLPEVGEKLTTIQEPQSEADKILATREPSKTMADRVDRQRDLEAILHILEMKPIITAVPERYDLEGARVVDRRLQHTERKAKVELGDQIHHREGRLEVDLVILLLLPSHHQQEEAEVQAVIVAGLLQLHHHLKEGEAEVELDGLRGTTMMRTEGVEEGMIERMMRGQREVLAGRQETRVWRRMTAKVREVPVCFRLQGARMVAAITVRVIMLLPDQALPR